MREPPTARFSIIHQIAIISNCFQSCKKAVEAVETRNSDYVQRSFRSELKLKH